MSNWQVICACRHLVDWNWILLESSVWHFVRPCQEEQEVGFVFFCIRGESVPEPDYRLVFLGKALVAGVPFHLLDVDGRHARQVDAELLVWK
jgi:hypothetical protein